LNEASIFWRPAALAKPGFPGSAFFPRDPRGLIGGLVPSPNPARATWSDRESIFTKQLQRLAKLCDESIPLNGFVFYGKILCGGDFVGDSVNHRSASFGQEGGCFAGSPPPGPMFCSIVDVKSPGSPCTALDKVFQARPEMLFDSPSMAKWAWRANLSRSYQCFGVSPVRVWRRTAHNPRGRTPVPQAAQPAHRRCGPGFSAVRSLLGPPFRPLILFRRKADLPCQRAPIARLQPLCPAVRRFTAPAPPNIPWPRAPLRLHEPCSRTRAQRPSTSLGPYSARVPSAT